MLQGETNLKVFFTKNTLNLVILLTVLFTVYYYSPFLFNPSDYLLNDKDDALKNYFCYEWHVQNDTTLVNYSGSNYPFGENHGYTDGNPLLSNFIKVLPFLKDYSIALYNLSIVLSFLFCAIIICKILKEFKLQPLFTIIATLGITILCPQVFRMRGHFALSYSFFIPLIIYYLLLYESRNRQLRFSILISLALLCYFFMHPYLGMIASAFVFVYWIIKFLFDLPLLKIRTIHFIIQSIIPVVIFFAYTKLTDRHTDRPTTPFGFLYFTSSIESVFISTLPPFRHMLSQLYKIKEQNWEGIAYIGITSLFTLFFIPYLFFKKKTILKSKMSENVNNKSLVIMIISSIILLIFSMGYPFKWKMEWLLDHLSFVKQFRAPGRFAWIFYFVFTIFSTIIVSKCFLPNVGYKARTVVCSLLLFLFVIEGIPYHQLSKNLPLVKNEFKFNNVDSELQSIIKYVSDKKAQAIIPLPFYHIGTDYYNIEGTHKIKKSSFLLSFHTQTPLMANVTPRTSLEESRKLTGILGTDLLEKELKTEITSNKIFYIFYSKEKLTDDESSLLAKGRNVLETQNYLLKEITPSELFTNKSREKIAFYESNKNSLIRSNDHLVTDSSYFIFKQTNALTNVSANASKIVLFEIPANSLNKNEIYEVSFWYKIGKDLDINYNVIVGQKELNDSTLVLANRNINSMQNIRKDRILASLVFQVNEPQNKIVIYLEGQKGSQNTFKINNLMIKRKDVDAYKKEFVPEIEDSVLTVNNFPLLRIK